MLGPENGAKWNCHLVLVGVAFLDEVIVGVVFETHSLATWKGQSSPSRFQMNMLNSQLLQHHASLDDNGLNHRTWKPAPIKCPLEELSWSWCLFTAVKP